MKICCAFAPTMDTPEHIELAEQLGFEQAWVFDTPAVQLDTWMTLALAAVRTSRIKLGPAVLVPSLRHVMVNASATAMLYGLAPDRVELAIGTGFSSRVAMGKRPNKWADVAEYVQQLQALLAGEAVDVDGAMCKMLQGPGQAPARPIQIPMILGTAGPMGENYARELSEGVFTVVPTSGFDRQVILSQGTVLDPGEPYDSPRAMAAAGGGAAVTLHRAYDRPGGPGRPNLEDIPGSDEWVAAVEAIDPKVRHLHTHEGHLTFVNDIDAIAINGDLIKNHTFTGEADVLREKLKNLEEKTVTEIAFQPAGKDIARELRAFANMAGIG